MTVNPIRDPTESSRSERERLALERIVASGRPRMVRLYADFGRDWPLWEDELDGDEVNICTAPADYGLDGDLTEEIHQWYVYWQWHYDPDTLWDGDAGRADWLTRAKSIARRIRETLPPGSTVGHEQS